MDPVDNSKLHCAVIDPPPVTPAEPLFLRPLKPALDWEIELEHYWTPERIRACAWVALILFCLVGIGLIVSAMVDEPLAESCSIRYFRGVFRSPTIEC